MSMVDRLERPWHGTRALLLALCVSQLGACTAGLYTESVEYMRPEEATFVPRAYLPPAGLCRVWHRDRPAQDQPPPGPCDVLRRQVPDGAVLVYGG